MDDQVKLLFIQEILYRHGDYVMDLLQEKIEKLSLIKSGELESSLNYKVKTVGDKPSLEISFLSYGRAIEIKYFSRNTSKFRIPNTNEVVWGIRNNKKSTKKKDTRWYSRTVYGSLNRLIGQLMSEFGDEEIKRLKTIIEQQNLRANAI